MVVYICQSQCVCKRDSVQLYIHKHNVCSKQNCSKRTLIHYRKHGQNTKGYLAKYIIFFGKNQTILFFFKPSKAAVMTRYAIKHKSLIMTDISGV